MFSYKEFALENASKEALQNQNYEDQKVILVKCSKTEMELFYYEFDGEHNSCQINCNKQSMGSFYKSDSMQCTLFMI